MFITLILILIVSLLTIYWYLSKSFCKTSHIYMTIEEFYHFHKDNPNVENEDIKDTIRNDMFNECPYYKANHQKSDDDYLNLSKYIRDFCCAKSSFTNRFGPVCPFLPNALKHNSIYFYDDIHSANKNQLMKTVRKCREDFLSILKPTEIENKNLIVYKCLIILIRSETISHRLIDEIQMELKSEFVIEHGLMLGEFHLSSNSSAIKNKEFYPLRTKVPLLVIRYLVANDIFFLNPKDKYSKEIRLKFLQTYFDLERKGLLHSAKDQHLQMAKEFFDQVNNEQN